MTPAEEEEFMAVLQLQSNFLSIFSKSIKLMKGLNDLENSLVKKLDEQPNSRSDSQ